MTETITAYKAFDENWKCRDFQYKVGETYEHSGKVKVCGSGFHSCELPFDCWNYYGLDAKLAKVEVSDISRKDDGDSKIASAKITIVAEMSIGDWIKDHVEVIKDLCKGKSAKAASGNYSNLAASGNDSVIVSSGINSRVKGIDGTVVALTLFDDNYKPVRVVPGIIGQDGLKPETWYRLDDGGNFVECN